ncbi:unnamed protein product [Triticum turgidum subsp. durum]|uniref:Scarecrow-like protein 6 n=1 Tax=Triticum turgidum subsp. durum TaxID=4567 RepID=A0A9R0QWJ9_TRITD|nr:unnamed protein product [Triticum turgidum subsp. durum]
MRGMPFAGEGHAGTLQQPKLSAGFWAEPTSVLDRRHSPSPSPPSEASALSSEVASLAPGGDAKNVSPPPQQQAWPAGEDATAAAPGVKEEWTHQLAPLDMGMGLGAGEGWDGTAPSGLAGPDSTFLRWIIGGGEDASAGMAGVMDPPALELDHATSMMSPPAASLGPSLSPFAPAMEDAKGAPFGHAPSFLLHQHQHHPPATVDQLAEAAKFAEAGDAFGAREILARLNYRLPAAPAAGTPLLRSAFYFKEALRLALSPNGETPAPPASTPYDVVLKLGAYKAFSEVSPVLQFAHLTCVQAVLDGLRGAGCIHVLDFDIGMGEQWASLMQELAQRRPATALKVTALVSPASHHPLELQLIHENLSSFAAELGVFFQFTVFNIDTLDPAELVAIAGGDALAVHLPVGAAHAAAMPAVLRLVKSLGAKVVVSVDRGCDRTELPFAAHLFQAFQSTVFLLESVDAVGTDPDTAGKIERFLVQPAVEQWVVGRHRASIEKAPLPWRAVFASAGFTPVQASTFAESQAESLLHKVPVRGFRVEKRAPGSLCLYWQRAELVSVSAWRC